MLTRLENAQKNWGGAHSAIDNWLEERKTMLVLYCQLSGVKTQSNPKQLSLPSKDDIQQFCQIMLDYLSAGHFEVYEQIISQCGIKHEEGKELAERIFPQINATTQVCLSFNDKYAESNADEDGESFDQDLSTLGEALEERFELEDQLIGTMYETEVVSANQSEQ